jgi:hypothetical protein
LGVTLGKWSFGRPRRKWEDNIKMDFKKIVSEDENLFNVVSTISSGNCGTEPSSYIRLPQSQLRSK